MMGDNEKLHYTIDEMKRRGHTVLLCLPIHVIHIQDEHQTQSAISFPYNRMTIHYIIDSGNISPLTSSKPPGIH